MDAVAKAVAVEEVAAGATDAIGSAAATKGNERLAAVQQTALAFANLLRASNRVWVAVTRSAISTSR